MEMQTPTPLTPCAVLAIYQGDTGGHYYIERHPVKNGKLHAGRPCTRKEMTKMAQAILNANEESSLSFRGAIPKNLISLSLLNGRKRLLWYVPAQQRNMYFDDSLDIPNGTAWQPDLLFYLDDDGLRVFGLRGEKTDPDAQVYLVPFHNTSEEGDVCMGSADIDIESIFVEDVMEEAEEAFYNSKFTHAGALYSRLTFNINTFWKDLIESQTPFPASGLIPSEHYPNIGAIISEINNNRYID